LKYGAGDGIRTRDLLITKPIKVINHKLPQQITIRKSKLYVKLIVAVYREFL